MRTAPAVLVLTLATMAAAPTTAPADRKPVRRGSDSADDGRRRGLDGDRSGRRPLEGDKPDPQATQKRKESTKIINQITPPRCKAANAPRFRKALLNIRNPNDRFNVEVWGNERVFFEFDSIFYFIRANRDAFVTMFWIGPEGSVFIPFANLKVEADRDHKIDPKNIIVQPVGLERWRVIATPQPHAFPCRGSDAEFMAGLNQVKTGVWASGRWDVWSKVRKRRRRRRRRWR